MVCSSYLYKTVLIGVIDLGSQHIENDSQGGIERNRLNGTSLRWNAVQKFRAAIGSQFLTDLTIDNYIVMLPASDITRRCPWPSSRFAP